MLQDLLRNIGLSDKEIAVYLGLLEIGPQAASVVAHKAKLNRSTTYVVLADLLKKGFISRFSKEDLQIYVAASPDFLLEHVKSKRSEYEKYVQQMTEVIPQLKSLNNPLSIRPKVSFYDGEVGVKAVMEDTLTARGTLFCYSSLDKWLMSPLKDYIEDYGKRRVFEKKIPLKALVNTHSLSLDYLKHHYPKRLTTVKWIPAIYEIFENEINIYDNKVSIVSLSPNQMFGIILESEQIATTQKTIFDITWRGIEAMKNLDLLKKVSKKKK